MRKKKPRRGIENSLRGRRKDRNAVGIECYNRDQCRRGKKLVPRASQSVSYIPFLAPSA